MRARGACLSLDMAGLVSARLVVATGCGHFQAQASSTYAGACAHAGRAPLASDHRTRCRFFRDGRRFSSRAASTSSPDLDGRAFGTLGAPGPGEGSAHQIAALVMWLKRHGVDFSDRARFVRVRGMGVGGLATRDLRAGDAIFSLPLFGVDVEAGDIEDAVPLVITTSVVMDQRGPLGRLANALAASGLVATMHCGDSQSVHAPTHRLGGVLESDHEFPLHVSATTLLALALLFQSAQATKAAKRSSRGESMRDRRKRRDAEAPSGNGVTAREDETKKPDADAVCTPHWSTYVDLLPRETDSLLEWSDEDLYHLRGSMHVSRALERRALVDGIHDEIFPALLAVDPGILAVGDDDEDDDDVSLASLETSAFASRRAFRWAFATVLARAFELPSEVREVRRAGDIDTLSERGNTSREKEFGLCPGLDLFNHGDDAEPCVVEGLDLDALEDDFPNDELDAPDSVSSRDPDDVRYDEDEARFHALGPRVTLRVGVGGAASGEQLFHKYADRADGGSVLEFGFARLDGSGARAADCDLSVLLKRHAPKKRAARLAYLAALGLCRGATYEVTDAPVVNLTGAEVAASAEYETSPFGDAQPRVGVACVPEDAVRVARILTLTDSEFDAVRAWDDDDAGKYDGFCAFGAAHKRRFAEAMAKLFEDERDALAVPAIHPPFPRGEIKTPHDDADDASVRRRARRQAMARCVNEGEVSLLEEIARDFRRLADEA